MKEQWKPVKDFEGKYIVSNFGNVMSIPRTCTDKLGRLLAGIKEDGFLARRMKRIE